MQVVNGYICHDCTDIDYARKNIDPAHPKDGPNREQKIAKEKAQEAEKKAELAREGQLGTRLHVLA